LNNLEIEDAKIILDFRKKVASHISAFEEARKDASEKLKPEINDEMSEELRERLVNEWNNKVAEALTEEINKDVDIDVKKTSPDAEAKILVNSKITIGEIETLRFLFG
jgi:hypothetical protein